MSFDDDDAQKREEKLLHSTTGTNDSDGEIDNEAVMQAGGNDQQHEEAEEEDEENHRAQRRAAIRRFVKEFQWTTLLNPCGFSCFNASNEQQPWVLVENGSFFGFFDVVPEHLRVGPWSTIAIAYISIFYAVAALATAHYVFGYNIENPFSSSTTTNDNSTTSWWVKTDLSALEYPSVESFGWWYHVMATSWMIYVSQKLAFRPEAGALFGAYTVQSWTLLFVRHILVLLAPFSTHSKLFAEYIRFPVACSASITFVIWNVLLTPAFYYFIMKTPEQKQWLYDFCTNFIVANMHMTNLPLALFTCSGLFFVPPRPLEHVDLYLAFMSLLMYTLWYWFVLDRLGLHLYPIFSPRDGRLFFVTASLSLGFYFATYYAWKPLFA